jgi:hypothetical protein
MTGKLHIKPKHIILFTILVVIVGLLVLAGLWIYPRAVAITDSYRHLDALSDELNVMVQNKDLDIDKCKVLFDSVSSEIKAIRGEVQPYYGLLNKLTGLPWLGKYAGQAEPVIEYASHTVSAAEDLLEMALPVMDNPVYSNNSSKLIQQINANQLLVVSAEDHLKRADEYHELIQTNSFQEKIQNKLRKIEQIQPLLTEAITVLKLVPVLTGAEKSVTYLIMLQNSDELRPTGGFITVFGLVRLEKGVVTQLEFEDFASNNYISKIIQAPEPLKQILLANHWLPRDANWSPSFPESAKQVQQLYLYSTGIKTDGVIALNQSTIAKVLKFIGPVKVSGQTISADNVKEYMIEQKMDAVKAGKAESRKGFIGPLVEAAIDSFSQQSGKENLINFAKLFQDLVNSGEIFIFSNNQDVQDLLAKYHFDGELQPGSGDYLMLVDANLSYSKIDLVIQRSFVYKVNLTDINSPSSKVEVTYKNPMEGVVTCRQASDIRTETAVSYLVPSCYGNYWRILGAKGTTLSGYDAPNFDDSYFLGGYGWSHTPASNTLSNGINEVSGLIVVPTNSVRTIILERILPPAVLHTAENQITYTLNIQKQSGIDQLPCRIEITIPAGTVVDTKKSSLPFTEQGGKWVWEGRLANSLTEVQLTISNK